MSKPFKFLLGFLTLLLSLALQFWMVPFGIRADFAFAALVTFAFLFDAWELAVLTLFAVLVIDWQPGISVGIAAFAVIPFAVYFLQQWIRANLWIGSMIAVAVSLCLLYLIISPDAIVSSFASFSLDAILCVVFGQFVVWGMESRA